MPEMLQDLKYDSDFTSDLESKEDDYSVGMTDDIDIIDYPPPPTSVSLSWKNLTYEITDSKTKNKRTIIQNVSGLVKPGEVLAVMGPSESDKSTFLELLAGRKDKTSISGQVLLNGRPGDVECVSTYITQDDALMGALTVRENIRFAADLCFPGISQMERTAHVQNTISEFGLEEVADSKIGTVFVKGISKGEKRRCAIASQVLTLPKIIFLDEPTTGLDSAAAYNVMNAIVTMAKRHQLTIIANIHEPSTETYALFDKLLLLGHGKTLYFGERENAKTHFEQLGHACPPYTSPADHFLRLFNSDFTKDITEVEQHITKFSISFSNSAYKSDIDAQIDDLIEKAYLSKSGFITKDNISSGYARSFPAQTFILMKRSLKNSLRNIFAFGMRVAMYIILAVLIGTTCWQVGYEQERIGSRFSAHFFSVAFLCFLSVAGIPGFLEERLVFQREHANGFYSVGPYVLSNTFNSMSFINTVATLFSLIAYPMIGLHSGIFQFFYFSVLLSLVMFVAESMMVFISAAIPIFAAALAITAFANGFFIMVGGYIVKSNTIPKIWIWAHYIDYLKYSFEAIIKNDFVGLTFNCAKIPDEGGNEICQCNYGGANATKSCQYTGTDVLNSYGYTEIDIFSWGLVLIGSIVVLRIGFFLVLHFRKGRY